MAQDAPSEPIFEDFAANLSFMSIALKCLSPRPMAAIRLICAPYAGAGASVFQQWAAALPQSIEPYALQLPGRENRLDDAAITDWKTLVETAAAAVAALPHSPLLLFGHSFGAIVALELSRALAGSSDYSVRHLFIAGMTWPGNWSQRPNLAVLDDDALNSAMQTSFGAAPPSFQDPQIRALALPPLRADLALLEQYQWRESAPSLCGLTVIAGTDDPMTAEADLLRWSSEASGPFDILTVNAGHYFLDSHRSEIAAAIAQHAIC